MRHVRRRCDGCGNLHYGFRRRCAACYIAKEELKRKKVVAEKKFMIKKHVISCVDCGEKVFKQNGSQYCGDLCRRCADIRIRKSKKASADRARERKKNESFTPFDRRVDKSVAKVMREKFLQQVGSTARREARKTVYAMMLMMGAQNFESLKTKMRSVGEDRAIRDKVVDDLLELLGEKR